MYFRVYIHISFYAVVHKKTVRMFGFLTPIYGEQTDAIMVAMIACLVATAVLLLTTAAGHGVLVCINLHTASIT